MRLFTNSVYASIALCAAAVVSVKGGDLAPPAGPVVPTMKTLQQVEPRIPINDATTPGDNDGTPSVFKITQSGSYYLTGNVTGVSGKRGIEVFASDVSIDLNGFSVIGVPGSTVGIFVTPSEIGGNFSVFNGTVRGWEGQGLTLNAVGVRVENVVLFDNASAAFVGDNSLVQSCTVQFNSNGVSIGTNGIVRDTLFRNNAGTALTTGFGNVVIACCFRSNTGDAMSCGAGAVISDCTFYNNGGFGISAGSGSTVQRCTVAFSGTNGIVASSACLVLSNASYSNGNAGTGANILVTGTDTRVEGNNCSGAADVGIQVNTSGNFIARNTVSGATTNWSVAAGNVCLVFSAIGNPAAINGNSGGVAPGSTDPNANFTY